MSPETKAQLVLLSVNLPAELAAQLDRFVATSGLNKTATTRLALRAFLANVPRAQQEM